jgi:AcrR family transcriptional regulator
MSQDEMTDAKSRQREEREAKRQNILDVARELFIEKGYDAVSMRDIAKKIRHTATALYTYFDSKEHIFSELCAQDFLGLRRAFEALAEVPDPIERLKRIGRAYVEFALKYPNHYELMFLTKKVPELNLENNGIERGNPDQDAYAFLRQAIVEAMESKRLGHASADPDLVAQMLWSSVHGIIALHMTHGNDPWIEWRPVPEIARMMIEVTIRGLT